MKECIDYRQEEGWGKVYTYHHTVLACSGQQTPTNRELHGPNGSLKEEDRNRNVLGKGLRTGTYQVSASEILSQAYFIKLLLVLLVMSLLVLEGERG